MDDTSINEYGSNKSPIFAVGNVGPPAAIYFQKFLGSRGYDVHPKKKVIIKTTRFSAVNIPMADLGPFILQSSLRRSSISLFLGLSFLKVA
jgi:hypothetical protein